jgi:SNF2 family DNA or RNA helicase
VPLSTLKHWQKEFELHTDANVVVYCDCEQNRKEIQKYEFITVTKNTTKTYIPNFDILLTTYNLQSNDKAFLKHIKWSCMIIGNTSIIYINIC